MFGDIQRVGGRGLFTLCVAVPLVAACQHGQRPTSAPSAAAEVSNGYGTMREGGATTSIASLTGKELKNQRVGRVEEMIQGRVSGVNVTQLSNGEYAIRIRGVSSLMGSNEPLVVVDGVQISTGASGALRAINPHDVARIEVLKDAAATAIYGIRGGNGVIVITTKR